MPAPNYPVSSPAIPQPGPTTWQDDAGYFHDELHDWSAQAIDQITNFLGFTGGHNVPVKLASVQLGGNQGSVSFQSIPAGYWGLRVAWDLRTNASSATTLLARFNNDTGSNYSYQVGSAVGSTAAAFSSASATSLYLGECTRTSDVSGHYTHGFFDLIGYWSTVHWKAILGRNCRDLESYSTSGFWHSTAAVNRIDLLPSTANSFIAGSNFTLLGYPA